MSYASGTTHYNLPQTVGTDKRDWFDTNQAFSDIDAAIYGAVQSASESASALTALTTRVGTNETNIADLQTSRTTDESRISALETLTAQHTTDIAGVKADALDMICAVDEGTAQVASVAVTEGNYFRYNDVLYMATTDIAVGDTIVPNTNCRATNVATELESIETGVESVSYTPISDGFTVDSLSVNRIGDLLLIDFSGNGAIKINEVTNIANISGLTIPRQFSSAIFNSHGSVVSLNLMTNGNICLYCDSESAAFTTVASGQLFAIL